MICRRLRVCLMLFLWLAALPASAVQNAPAEAFALMDPGDDAASFQQLLALPFVDGIAVRTSWSMIEPEEGKYEWTRLDEAFTVAKAAHKKITLHIIASAYAHPPSWLKNKGAQYYSVDNPFRQGAPAKEEIVPWDGVFLDKWAAFTKALSAHINAIQGFEQLGYVSVSVPMPEMSLIGCHDGKLSTSPPLDYSRDAYLSAWQKSAAAIQSAFPLTHKMVSAPVAQICMPDNDGARFYSDLFQSLQSMDKYGYMIFAADLNAAGSQRLANIPGVLGQAEVGLQFIASYSNDPGRFDGSLADAICKGYRQYNGRYFEIYKQDILNSDAGVQHAIGRIHAPDQCP